MSCIHRIPLGFTSWLFRSSSNHLVKAHAGFWRQFYAALNSLFVPASQNTDVILFHYVLLDLYGSTTSVGVRGSYLRIRVARLSKLARITDGVENFTSIFVFTYQDWCMFKSVGNPGLYKNSICGIIILFQPEN